MGRLTGKWAVFLMILAFFAIQLVFMEKYKPLMWDEATYIGMGKYIYSAGNVGIWEEIRPLGLPLLLGLMWKIGLGTFFSYKLLALLFSVGTLYVAFLIGRRFMRPEMAAFSAAILGFAPIFFTSATDILTDIPSLFFSLLAVYFFMENKPVFSGISAFFAFFFRFPHFLIVISIIISLFLYEKRAFLSKCIRFLVPFILLMVIFIFFNALAYGFSAIAMPFLLASSHQGNEVYAVNGFLNNLFYYLIHALWENVLLLFFVPGIVFAVKKKKPLVLVIALFAYLSYFTIIANKQDRFFIAFIPFVSLLSVYWIESSVEFAKRHGRFFAYSFALILAFVVIVSFVGVYFRLNGHYQWLSDQESNVTGVYGFFSGKNAEVLTSDPIFSAYSDSSRFIHYYSNPQDAIQKYEANKGTADFVVYTPDFYPCERFGPECEEKKQFLFERIKADNQLILNRTSDGRQFYIFSAST